MFLVAFGVTARDRLVGQQTRDLGERKRLSEHAESDVAGQPPMAYSPKPTSADGKFRIHLRANPSIGRLE